MHSGSALIRVLLTAPTFRGTALRTWLDAVCPGDPAKLQPVAAGVGLLYGIGSAIAGLRATATFLRRNDPWSEKLDAIQRVLVVVFGLGTGIPIVVLATVRLLWCPFR